jgi:hypothetical protein
MRFAAAVIKDAKGTSYEAWAKEHDKTQAGKDAAAKAAAQPPVFKEGDKITVSKDGKSYTFTIGQKVKYAGSAAGAQYKQQDAVIIGKEGNNITLLFKDGYTYHGAYPTSITSLEGKPAAQADKTVPKEETPPYPGAKQQSAFQIGGEAVIADPNFVMPYAQTMATEMGSTNWYTGNDVKAGDVGVIRQFLNTGSGKTLALVTMNKNGMDIVVDIKGFSKWAPKEEPTVTMKPVASKPVGPKPTEVGGMHIGDKVAYAGNLEKLKNDTGIVKLFSAYHPAAMGVKWDKLGQVVWVSHKSIVPAGQAL